MAAPGTTHHHTPSTELNLLHAVWVVIQLAIMVYGLGVTLYLVLFAALGERWPWIALANNFLAWWALGGVIAAAIALLARRRGILVSLQLPVIMAFLVLYGGRLLPHDAAATAADSANGMQFSAATFNIIASQSDPDRVIEAIVALDADIVGLEEVGPRHSAQIERELAEMYPYQVHYPKLPVHGVSLLSRYPIVTEELFLPLPDSMNYLRAEVNIDGEPLTVYVVHPSPPTHVTLPFSYNSDHRDTAITILHDEYLAHENGPVIVLGDFNMSDLSDPYRVMNANFDDAFATAGQGLGFTFPANRPMVAMPRLLRIDYVWYNDHVAALDARVGGDSGTSDHMPVVADLALIESTGD